MNQINFLRQYPFARAVSVLIFASMGILFSGCAREISSGTYHAEHVGEASVTYEGTIVSARDVLVKGHEQFQDNVLGMGIGGVAGGVAGHQLGKGKGKDWATGVGAVAGALAGGYAEQKLKEQNGVEYVVRRHDGGGLLTVVQGPNPRLAVGQYVMIQVSQKGRSRVIPMGGQAPYGG